MTVTRTRLSTFGCSPRDCAALDGDGEGILDIIKDPDPPTKKEMNLGLPGKMAR